MRESSGDGLQEHPCWAGLKSFVFVNNMDGWLAARMDCLLSRQPYMACCMQCVALEVLLQVSHGWLAWMDGFISTWLAFCC